jgi:hypothetical protein
MFVKASKKVIDNYKDTRSVHYRVYYGYKKFYDTDPRLASSLRSYSRIDLSDTGLN